MKNLSMYNENKDFEKVVTKFYGEEFCEVLIGWTDALGYRLIKTDLMGEFQLWESDSFDNNIAVNTDEIVNINDVISIVSKEIDIALDEFKGIEENKLSEDDKERKTDILSDYSILKNTTPKTLEVGTLVNIINENTLGRIEGFLTDELKYMVEPLNTDFTQNLFHVYPDEINIVNE